MAEIWAAAVATVAVGAYSANRQSAAGRDASRAQQRASDAATAEQARQFDQTRTDMQPWMQAGGWAIGEQQNFLQGDYGQALNSPFYKAAMEEGFKGLDAGAAAQGNLWGGGMDADRMRLGQNLASQQLGTYYNALAGMSNTGQTTANQLGQYGQDYARAVGYNANNAAEARASSYANTANAWGQFANTASNAFGDYMWQRNRQQQGGG